MLQLPLTLTALATLHILGFALGTADHVDINPADMYVRGLDESQHLELFERHKRQDNPDSREMFVTQCGYYNTVPEAEPSISVKGIGLNNWAAVEKVTSRNETLPGVLGNRGTRAYFSGEQRSKNKGNRGTKAILGNREHRKSTFCFWGTGDKGHLFQENKGTGTPPLPIPPREGLRNWIFLLPSCI